MQYRPWHHNYFHSVGSMLKSFYIVTEKNKYLMPLSTRTPVILLILASSLLLSNCSRKKKSEFTFSLNEVSLCLPAGDKDAWSWITVNRSDLEAFFSQNGFSFNPDDIDVVKFYSGTIEIVSPPGANFNEVIVLEVFFREAGSSSTGTKVAYLTNIADNAVSVNLENQYSELQSFFQLDSFEAGLHLNRNPASDNLCVKGKIELRVVINE
ncbi:MAG: hypothetical protein KatS3mg031_1773 [Chitinophagales bacterium]|nr:MAG: hypothetical protein KatS3mg031_1773 [Chitinophagales bacterium]